MTAALALSSIVGMKTSGWLLVISLVAAIPQPSAADEVGAVAAWRGPAADFVKGPKGRITGGWWQGGAVGVGYFTGPGAQKLPLIEETSRTVAAAAGLPYVEIHRDDVVETEADPNSMLLYPDGTSRVCLLMMPGGQSAHTAHDVAGIDKGLVKRDYPAAVAAFEKARVLPRQAVATGMNYIGCCGGAYMGASGYTMPNTVVTGWCLWPGRLTGLGPDRKQPFPAVVFAETVAADHPLRAAGGERLENMYFNGGPLDFEAGVPHTEYIATYQGGAATELEGKQWLVAYLPADQPASGRVVLCSAHPEANHPDVFRAMQEYAIARPYAVPRNLVKGTKPLKGVSGDRQLQYYCVPAVAGKKMTVKLSSDEGRCSLFVRHDLPPLFEVNDGAATEAGVAEKMVEIKPTKKGDYYIGVYGDHDEVRGVPYTLSVKMAFK